MTLYHQWIVTDYSLLLKIIILIQKIHQHMKKMIMKYLELLFRLNILLKRISENNTYLKPIAQIS